MLLAARGSVKKILMFRAEGSMRIRTGSHTAISGVVHVAFEEAAEGLVLGLAGIIQLLLAEALLGDSLLGGRGFDELLRLLDGCRLLAGLLLWRRGRHLLREGFRLVLRVFLLVGQLADALLEVLRLRLLSRERLVVVNGLLLTLDQLLELLADSLHVNGHARASS